MEDQCTRFASGYTTGDTGHEGSRSGHDCRNRRYGVTAWRCAYYRICVGESAQRSLAQSMARGLGPAGIHVSYVVIDGVIDLERTRSRMPDHPDRFFLQPDAIAETVYQLTEQDSSAWSFEVDLRPYAEKW